jgi:glycosyltransferase involved in cell wall biosynthesis
MTSRVTCFPTIHNNQEFQYGSGGIKGRLNRWAYRLMVQKCGGVVACSEEVRSSLVETLGLAVDPGEKLVSIPNAVPEPEPVSEAESQATRQGYGIPLKAPLILGAGRLTDQKNFSLLLAAAAGVLEKMPEARVLIAGEGELRADLEKQTLQLGIQDRVVMPGNVDDLDRLMATADVFVLSSRFEGLPLVLLESMSHGMPTVCTRIKGTEDVIAHGQNGFLVAPDSVGELAQAVTQILGDPGLARELGTQALNTIQARYSFAVLMDRLAELYTRSLNK